MKYALLLFLLGVMASCLNSTNSFTGDKILSSKLGVGAEALAQGKCMTCHEHTHWSDYTTNDEFIAELKPTGDILPGNADGSGLIVRITGGDSSREVMPPGTSGIDTDVTDLFKQWINGMQDTTPTP